MNHRQAGPDRMIFQPIDTVARFGPAVLEFESAMDRGAGPPIPVWVGPRSDLNHGIALAADLYDGIHRPPGCDLGVVVGAGVPEELRRFARPLARTWAGEGTALEDTEGSLLIVGCYADLRAAVVRPVLEDAYRRGRDVFLLTGRDLNSLSWAIAKQYAEMTTEAPTGLFTEIDESPQPTRAPYFHAGRLDSADIRALVLERTWGRILFNGHGTDDSVNLGQFTVCGLSPAVAGDPPAPGPMCAYGLGCYKPMDKLIAVHRVRAAEIVLSGCDSGPLVDLASYGPGHQLLLNAIDGPARTVVAALSMHQSGRVENLLWLDSAGREGSTARVLNESLRDIHPYPSFIQAGLPGSGRVQSPSRPAGREADPAPWHRQAELRALVRTVSARLQGFLTTGLLSPRHGLRDRLERTAEEIDSSATRLVMGLAAEQRLLMRSLEADLRSLDRALAERVAEDPDDDIMEFPRFFGHRSSVAEEDVTTTPCVCGRPAWRYVRRGFTARVPDTVALGCLRCGPVGYALAGGVTVRGWAADSVTAGGTLRVEAEVEAVRSGEAQVGVSVPGILRARIGPPLHRVRLRAGEPRRVAFDVGVDGTAAPQEYHYTVFAIQDLGISVLRHHFGVLPDTGRLWAR
ncbi:hypothetical protein ACWDOR_17820 [Streptosporangium canum]|uniref:hypothetical protein n=1 Tax=Streptosporangium canum TaxID=324952 RepID=UPI0036A99A80